MKEVFISPKTKLGDGTTVGLFSIIGYPSKVLNDIQNKNINSWSSDVFAETTIGANVTVQTSVFVGDGSCIGDNSSLGHSVHIGHNSKLGARVEVFHRAQILDRVDIGNDCWVGGFICNDSSIGERSVVYGRLIHKFVDAVRGIPEPPPVVEEDVFIGEAAIVIGGVTIEAGAYVAAGSVVTKSIPRGRLVVGNPAKDAGPAPKPFKDYQSRF